jgi:hypothetical protein
MPHAHHHSELDPGHKLGGDVANIIDDTINWPLKPVSATGSENTPVEKRPAFDNVVGLKGLIGSRSLPVRIFLTRRTWSHPM